MYLINMALGFLRVSKANTLIRVLCLLLPASIFAAPHKRLPKEELEKYEDPPMYIFRVGVSAPMVSRFGAFTSVQVNVDANGRNISGTWWFATPDGATCRGMWSAAWQP